MVAANIALGGSLALLLFLAIQRKLSGGAFSPVSRPYPDVLLPILAFIGVSIVSAIFSTSPSRSVGEIKGLLTFLLVPAGLVLIRNVSDGWFFLDLLRLTQVMIGLQATLEVLAGKGDLGTRLTGGLSNHMTFAGLLMPLTLLLGAAALDRGRSGRDRVLDALLFTLGVVLLALSLTRSAYLGFIVGAILLLFLHRPKTVWILPPAMLALLFMSPADVKDRAKSIFDPEDPTSRDRIVMWKAGRLMIEDHPLVGVGPGRVKELYAQYRQPGYVEPHPGHLHNNLVMIAAETGLPSMAIYLWFTGAFFAGVFRERRKGNKSGLLLGSAAAMISLFVAGQFEYNFGDVEILRFTLLLSVLPFRMKEPPLIENEAAS